MLLTLICLFVILSLTSTSIVVVVVLGDRTGGHFADANEVFLLLPSVDCAIKKAVGCNKTS